MFRLELCEYLRRSLDEDTTGILGVVLWAERGGFTKNKGVLESFVCGTLFTVIRLDGFLVLVDNGVHAKE